MSERSGSMGRLFNHMKKGIRALMRTIKSWRGQRRGFGASIRPSDVFIVTYPKSGTVWLRFMIDNVLHKNPEEELSLRRDHPYIPDINRLYFSNGSLNEFANLPDPRFFWVHAPYDQCLPKVVYVLRDPRDVMVSYWHWKRLNDRTFSCSLAEFVASDDPWPCRWDQHVEGWLLSHKHSKLIPVRYEDMHRDPIGVLKQVLSFLNVPHTQKDVERAVAAGRFEHMKSLEDKMRANGVVFGIDDDEKTVANPAERFIRRGQIGSWKDELSGESLRILEERYGKIMGKVGYEPITQP